MFKGSSGIQRVLACVILWFGMWDADYCCGRGRQQFSDSTIFEVAALPLRHGAAETQHDEDVGQGEEEFRCTVKPIDVGEALRGWPRQKLGVLVTKP